MSSGQHRELAGDAPTVGAVPSGSVDPQSLELPGDPSQTFDPNRTKMMTPSGGTSKPTASAAMREWGEAAFGSRFRPQGIINAGGYGEVWKALQVSLDRTIAIKRVRTDLRRSGSFGKSEDLDALFRHEAFTAASLEHPNILPVYELGEDPDGHPLLAMKLIHGEAWNTLIERDFEELSVAAFLRRHLPILISVTNAVAFAHDKGIIHRDLKPSQVMVGRFGEVLLMDWGLAVSLADPRIQRNASGEVQVPGGTDYTLTTPAGTPAFMAPEQGDKKPDRLGTWTDIYLLGGTLYQLLTGKAPHDAPSSQAAYWRAVKGLVTPPDQMAPDREVPRDLARLAMHAMSFEISDRIPTAEEFRRGLEDHLSGASRRTESIELIAQARERLAGARGDYHAFSETAAILSRAQALWSENPDHAALQESTQREFAIAALANGDLQLARVQAGNIADPAARMGLVARIDQKERELASRERQRHVAFAGVAVLLAALVGGGLKYSYDQARATLAAEKARIEAEDFRARSERLSDFMISDLSNQLRPIGRLKLLDDVSRNALAYYASVGTADIEPSQASRYALGLRNIGDVLRDTGQSDEALRAYTKSLEITRGLAEGDPGDEAAANDLIRTLNALSRLLRERGDLPAALAHAREASDIGARFSSRPDASEEVLRAGIDAMTNVTLTLLGQGKPDDALANQQRVLAVTEGASRANPRSQKLQLDYASANSNLALTLQRKGDASGALAAHRNALSTREKIAEADPDQTANLFGMARTLMVIAQLESRAEPQNAGATTDRALSIFERLDAIDPLNLDWQREYGAALNAKAMMTAQRGDDAAAVALLRRVLAIRERLVRADPSNAVWLRDLSVVHNTLAHMLAKSGDQEGAMEQYRRDLEIAERLSALDPTNETWTRDLAASHQAVGERLMAQGDTTAALTSFLVAAENFGRLHAAHPDRLADANDYAWSRVLAARAMIAGGNARGANAEVTAANEALRPFMGDPATADPNAMDTYVQALLMAGHADIAKPYVEVLIRTNKASYDLKAMAEKAGISLEK